MTVSGMALCAAFTIYNIVPISPGFEEVAQSDAANGSRRMSRLHSKKQWSCDFRPPRRFTTDADTRAAGGSRTNSGM